MRHWPKRCLLAVSAAALLFLGGCQSQGQSVYELVAVSTQPGLQTGGPYPRTWAEIDAYPYAQLGIRLPGALPGIMVLTAFLPDGHRWSSADGATIETDEYGRIRAVEIAGFVYRLTRVSAGYLGPESVPGFGDEQRYAKSMIVNGWAVSMMCSSFPTQRSPETMTLQGRTFETLQYVETCEPRTSGGSSLTSLFWITPDGRVVRTSQSLSDEVRIDTAVLKAPTADPS